MAAIRLLAARLRSVAFLLLLAAFSTEAFTVAGGSPPLHPNILFIFADDLTC